MNLLSDERAENPIEVALYVMLVIMVMTGILFVAGNFLDNFIYTITNLDIPLSAWGQGMMEYVLQWASWVYLIPPLFIIIVMVWGIKTVFKRTDYSAQDQSYMNYEEEI